jgi:subtilase family serine protease
MRLGRVTVLFRQTPEQQAELQLLLDELQDRSSPNYHRWLTPESFADRFGLSPADVDKLVSWLQLQGLTIEQVSRSRTWVAFSGTAQQVESALRTEIRRYAVSGETRYANSRDPSVPSAMAGVVLGFRGLHDFRLKPRAATRKLQVTPGSRFTSFASGMERHFLAPDDFATIYNLHPLYNMGIDGAGQKIAVVGQSAINLSDIQTFRSLSGLPANDPQVTLVPGGSDPGMVAGDIDEANLDVEWAGAVARRATILYVYADPNNGGVLEALVHAIEEKLAPVISISYGLCEQDGGESARDFFEAAGQQANAQGITIVGPSGDAGAADCDHDDPPASVADEGLAVDLPAALPYATAVGGTRFSEGSGVYWNTTNNSSNGSALSYIPEVAWNDTDGTRLAASGGGTSIFFPKPSWQTGNGVPSDDSRRHVPDVSFNASADHDGYLVCSQDHDAATDTFSPTCENGFRRVDPDPFVDGTLTVFGGTSVGVPTFAGVVALINQLTNSPQGQGNINYILYPLAQSFPPAFHDITAGDNKVPCMAGSTDCPSSGPDAGFIGFSAGPGYDRVTGLGSVDAFSLVTAWTSVSATPASTGSTDPDFQLALSPPNLTVIRGGSGAVQLTISAINGFASSVNASCSVSGSLVGVTCSVAGGPGLGTRTVTVTASGGPDTASGPFAGDDLRLAAPGGIILLTTWCIWVVSRTGNRRPKFAPALVLACLLAVAVGCKNDSENVGAEPGSGVVTVQATSGSISRAAQLAVIVE